MKHFLLFPLLALSCAAQIIGFDSAALDAAKRTIPTATASAPVAREVFVAWPAGQYAPEKYTTFMVGHTRGLIRNNVKHTGTQFHATGGARPAGINATTPVAEISGAPYELVMNVDVLDENGTVVIAGIPITWNGSRLLTVWAGQDYASDPLSRTIRDDWSFRYNAVVSRQASMGQTFGGQPGQLALSSDTWPRTEAIGGALNTYGIYGTKWTTTTADLAAWTTALDAGEWAPAGTGTTINSGGWSPIAVTGWPLDANYKWSVITVSDSIDRSNDGANRMYAGSGRGYIQAALENIHGGFCDSVSGQALEDMMVPANILRRRNYFKYADVMICSLGSNTLKGAVTVDQYSALIDDWNDYVRSFGVRRIIYETVPYRWAGDYRTYEGQVEAIAGFNAKAAAWATRLGEKKAAGLIDDYYDRRTPIQDPAQGYKWRLPVMSTIPCTSGSTLNSLKFAGASWLADQYTSWYVYVAGFTDPYRAFGNSAAALTTTGPATAVTTGALVDFFKPYTLDGVHQQFYGHAVMAAAWPVSIVQP